MKNIAFWAVAGLLLCSSKPKEQKEEISKFNWLIGSWENKTARGSTIETWTKKTAVELTGKSYRLKAGDTIVLEEIRIIQEQEAVYYVPVVKNQNQGLPVRFRMVAISDSGFRCENPAHDFPQVITYQKIGTDSLLAEIAGTANGQYRKLSFPMKRLKK